MGQAFDERGQALGAEIFGNGFKDVLEKVQKEHPDAHEILLQKVAMREAEQKAEDFEFRVLSEKLVRLERRVQELEEKENE